MDLPDEVLDDVLRRVPPRRLAACRRVCRSWRAVIDGRGLVLAHLAPGPVRGIFVNYIDTEDHGFFSRAATPPSSIDGSLMYLPNVAAGHNSRRCVWDHCNGLLLYQNNSKVMYVCNPATRRWATLPPRPVDPAAGVRIYRDRLHLLFDPAVSLHHRVMFFPEVPGRPRPPRPDFPGKKRPRSRSASGKRPPHVTACGGSDDYYIENLPPPLRARYEQEVENVGSMEWPPCSYALQVFSSETGLWEKRCFVRQGDAVTTVSEMWSHPYTTTWGMTLRCYAAVYLQGAFYLNCPGGFIMRFSLLEGKYTAIKTPRLIDTFFQRPISLTDVYGRQINLPRVYLAKSKLGIYYTALQGYRLQIWILHGASEPCQMPEWELKHQVDLEPSFSRHYARHDTTEETAMSWILTPSKEVSNDGGDHGWDSSDDCIVIDTEEGIRNNEASTGHEYGVDLLGYHPHREIVFLGNRYNGFAYYLGSSKLQYFGRLYPKYLVDFDHSIITYIYTPCKDDLLPAQNVP